MVLSNLNSPKQKLQPKILIELRAIAAAPSSEKAIVDVDKLSVVGCALLSVIRDVVASNDVTIALWQSSTAQAVDRRQAG